MSRIANELRGAEIIDRVPQSDAESLAAWVTHHDLVPRQQNGKHFAANPNRLLAILAGLSHQSATDEVQRQAA
jgi:hypothetical protein